MREMTERERFFFFLGGEINGGKERIRRTRTTNTNDWNITHI